jgi:5-methylcytosine-specific restriction endonuclease McrA
MNKVCNKCKEEKPEIEEYFVFRKDTGKYRGTCRTCQNKRTNELYTSNVNGMKDRYKKYREENNNKIKDRYQSNKEAINEKHKKWYWENRERELGKLRTRQEDKREYYRKINNESYHRNKNKDYNITRVKNYLNSLRNPELESDFSYDDWVKCLEAFDYSCAYCGADTKKLEREHVVPVVKAGNFTPDNVIPACRNCNAHKYNSDFTEWYPKQIFYTPEREQKIISFLNSKSIKKGKTA